MNSVVKAAVFSDSHGLTALMRECVRRVRPDVIIHLGDYSRDADALRRMLTQVLSTDEGKRLAENVRRMMQEK